MCLEGGGFGGGGGGGVFVCANVCARTHVFERIYVCVHVKIRVCEYRFNDLPRKEYHRVGSY